MAATTGDDRPFAAYRSKVILGVVIAFSVTSTVSLVLRFVGKRIKNTSISAEDWLIIVAQIAVYALGITSILEVVLGNAGHHAADDPSKVPVALKILIAEQCLYAVALGAIKISICVFYNRIFDVRSFHIASWTTIAVIITWALAAILYAVLACRPLALFWDPAVRGTCVPNKVAPLIVIGALEVVVDIAILVLPLPLLWKLRVSLADKFALCCIFGAGISTIVIGILRTEALVKVSFTDVTYTGAYPLVWTFVEPAIGISVACAPLFRPIFRTTHSQQDIELASSISHHSHSHRPSLPSLPSFIDSRIHFGKVTGHGRQEVYLTMQVLESGNWSQASLARENGG